jgi:hypothetical protein
MASALSEALARKTNLEANKFSPKDGGMGRMGKMMEPDGDEAEATDPVEDAMSVLFPDRDPVEAAAAFRRACAACETESSEPEAETEIE